LEAEEGFLKEIQACIRQQIMYENRLWEKEKQIVENEKELDAKDVAFQVLAARKTFLITEQYHDLYIGSWGLVWCALEDYGKLRQLLK